MLYEKYFLQVEFDNRQQATRFNKLVSKDKKMSKYLDCKIGRTVFLKFDTKSTKDSVCDSLLKTVKGIEIRKRPSADGVTEGFDYLFVK